MASDRRFSRGIVPAALTGCLRSSGVEWCSTDQHPVQDDRKLAREAHLGLLHPAAPGDPHRPALKLRAAFDRLYQHDLGGLIKRRANRSIADLSDTAGHVGLTGLILLRGQPEMRS